MAGFFALIQVILKALSLWEGFVSWLDAERIREAEEARQRREQAIDDATKATTPEDAWRAQEGVVDNEP